MEGNPIDTWELWYPKGAANGLLFGRSKIDPAEVVLVHSAPEFLTVTVRGADGAIKAEGIDLPRAGDSPMTLLRRVDKTVTRAEIWPGEAEVGLVVLLPGGEAGILQSWWHAGDYSEWRWQLSFYNSKT